MAQIIDELNKEISRIENENELDDYHEGLIDGLIIAIKTIKEKAA